MYRARLRSDFHNPDNQPGPSQSQVGSLFPDQIFPAKRDKAYIADLIDSYFQNQNSLHNNPKSNRLQLPQTRSSIPSRSFKSSSNTENINNQDSNSPALPRLHLPHLSPLKHKSVSLSDPSIKIPDTSISELMMRRRSPKNKISINNETYVIKQSRASKSVVEQEECYGDEIPAADPLQDLLNTVLISYQLIRRVPTTGNRGIQAILRHRKTKQLTLVHIMSQAEHRVYSSNLREPLSIDMPMLQRIPFQYSTALLYQALSPSTPSLYHQLFFTRKHSDRKYRTQIQKLYRTIVEDDKLFRFLLIEIILMIQQVRAYNKKQLFLLGFGLQDFIVQSTDLGGSRIPQKILLKDSLLVGNLLNSLYRRYLLTDHRFFYAPPQLAAEDEQELLKYSRNPTAGGVWAFGLVLLELLTCVPVHSPRKTEVENKSTYEGVLSPNRGNLKDLHDELCNNPVRFLDSHYSTTFPKRWAKIFQEVFQRDPECRPSTSQLIRMVEL